MKRTGGMQNKHEAVQNTFTLFGFDIEDICN